MPTAIPNKYKNTLDDLINSSDTKSPDQPKSPDWPKPIDKGTHNARRFKGALLSLSKEDCLDKDVLVTSLGLAPKIRDSQIYKCHDIPPFGPKSGRA